MYKPKKTIAGPANINLVQPVEKKIEINNFTMPSLTFSLLKPTELPTASLEDMLKKIDEQKSSAVNTTNTACSAKSKTVNF